MYASIGTDGMRRVVWGIGATPKAATEDARYWLASDGSNPRDVSRVLLTHDIEEITDTQAAIVRTGDVSWPIVVWREKLREADRHLEAAAKALADAARDAREKGERGKHADAADAMRTNVRAVRAEIARAVSPKRRAAR